MKIQNSSIWLCVVFLLITGLVSSPVFAMEDADNPLLIEFKKEEPEIFKRTNLVTEQDRELLELSLKDVLKLVLNRSMTIEAGRMGEKAAIEGFSAAREQFQSVVTVGTKYNKSASLTGTNLEQDSTVNPYTGLTSPYLSSTGTNSTTFSTTWSRKNSQGITFSSVLQKTTSQSKPYTMSEKNGDIEEGSATDDPLESASLTAGISIPVFQDWGDINNLTIHKSGLLVEQSKLSTRTTGIGLLELVAKTYWNLVGIRENIATLQDAVKLSEQLVSETDARVRVGVLNPTDLKEAMTQLASNRQSLLSARIEEQEVEDQIKVALNMGRIPYGFKPADNPGIHKEQFDFESLLQKTLMNSTDIEQMRISLKSNKYDLDEAMNMDRTNLDLSVQYSLSGYGSSSSEAINNFSKSEYQGYQADLTWTVPLFDKVTPKTIMKRKIERSQLELKLKDKELELYVKLQTNLRNLMFGIEEEKTATLSLNLAKDLLEKEVEKLKIGKSTSYYVTQAQQKYTTAKLNEILVRVKNEQNFVSLLVLTGDIFEYFELPKTI